MGFKSDVLFYLNEAKKDKYFEEKKKVCAGCEADGSSVKTEKKKGANTGCEANMYSVKTNNGCTGSEASESTEKPKAVLRKKNGDVKEIPSEEKVKETSTKEEKEDPNTVEHVMKKMEGKTLFDKSKKVKKSPKVSDEELKQYTVDYVASHKDDIKPAKGNKLTPNTGKVKDIIKNAALVGNKSSCKTEEASVVAYYDQKKSKVVPGTNETKTKGSMKGFEIGKMSSVGNKKQKMDKYKDYGENRIETVPGTNETKAKGSMKGFSLKESISYFSKENSVISEDLISEEKVELITESIKSKSASKKLLKVAQKLNKEAQKENNPEIRAVILKNEKLFKKAFSEISAVEDDYKAGDPTAKEKYKKLTKKYANEFKVANKNNLTKMILGGAGIAAIIAFVGGSVLLGSQGIFEPGLQFNGIEKLTLNSPLDGIKHFFGFGKKVIQNDLEAVKQFFSTKDLNSIKEVLNSKKTTDKDMLDTMQNLANGVSDLKFADEGKGEAANSIKDFISKMSKKGDKGDFGNSINI